MSTVARSAKVDRLASQLHGKARMDGRLAAHESPPQLKLSSLTPAGRRLLISFEIRGGRELAQLVHVILAKRFVYVLRSQRDPSRYYTGLTSDVFTRLAIHNAGHCVHTSTGKPWEIDVVVEFADERRAVAFETYLKAGSGVAFSKRHLR